MGAAEHCAARADGHDGDSSETDVSEFTINPTGSPSGAARDKGHAGRESAERMAERTRVRRRRVRAGATRAISVERRSFAERDVGEVVVGAIGAEGVHERAGFDVAVRAGKGTAGEVSGAS